MMEIMDSKWMVPSDIKKGILNLPCSTRSLSIWRFVPSKGRAPHTKTYSTTPKLWNIPYICQLFTYLTPFYSIYYIISKKCVLCFHKKYSYKKLFWTIFIVKFDTCINHTFWQNFSCYYTHLVFRFFILDLFMVD